MRLVSGRSVGRYNARKERANAEIPDSGILYGARFEGVIKEGGSKRREAAEQAIKGMGGRLEAYYYAFGSDDFVSIVDLPSNVDAAALLLAICASGAVEPRTTVLITPEEADQATKKVKTVKYRPPGQ